MTHLPALVVLLGLAAGLLSGGVTSCHRAPPPPAYQCDAADACTCLERIFALPDGGSTLIYSSQCPR